MLKKSFIYSLILHLIIFAAFIIDFKFKKKTEAEDVVIVEMVEVKDQPRISKLINKEKPKKKEGKKVINKQKAKKEIKKPMQQKPKKIKPSKKAVAVKPKPEMVKKAKVKQDIKKEEAAKQQKSEQKTIESLLKNLEQKSSGSKKLDYGSKQKVSEPQVRSGSRNSMNVNQMVVTEYHVIKYQIERYWQIPTGIKNIQDFKVTLHIIFNEDATIADLTVKSKDCPAGYEDACKLFVDNALRAVKQAAPYENLRPSRFKIWREFDINFNPGDMVY